MAPCKPLAAEEALRSDVTTVNFNPYKVRGGFGNWYGLMPALNSMTFDSHPKTPRNESINFLVVDVNVVFAWSRSL